MRMYVEKFGQHIPDTTRTFAFRATNDKDIHQEREGTKIEILTYLKIIWIFFCLDDRKLSPVRSESENHKAALLSGSK